MPGLLGAIAGKEEFKVPTVPSGVTERLCAFGGLRRVLLGGGGDTGGVLHENVAAAGEALLDIERLLDGREGKMVEDDADAEAFAQGSPPSISVPLDEPC